MIGDALKDLSQIILGIEFVELGGLDQRIGCGSRMAAGIRAGEQPVLATM
jgi:hypothetical protein